MTRVKLEKSDLPKPCDVFTSVKELAHWREVRISKDLPTGALDNALTHLRAFNDLLNEVYLLDLEEHDGQLGFCYGQEVETAEDPGPDA